MSSWHYNKFTNASIIQDCVDLLNDSNFMNIYTTEQVFCVTADDKVNVGNGAMMIANADNDYIVVINTNTINHIEIKPNAQ